MGRQDVIIDGQTIPRRRFTGWAWAYFIAFVALPVIGIGALIDYILFLTLFR